MVLTFHKCIYPQNELQPRTFFFEENLSVEEREIYFVVEVSFKSNSLRLNIFVFKKSELIF